MKEMPLKQYVLNMKTNLCWLYFYSKSVLAVFYSILQQIRMRTVVVFCLLLSW